MSALARRPGGTLPPMLARPLPELVAAFEVIDRHSARLRSQLALVEWEHRNDPDEAWIGLGQRQAREGVA